MCSRVSFSRITTGTQGHRQRGNTYSWQTSQEVCPYPRKFSTPTAETAFWAREGVHGAEFTEQMSLSQEEFSRRFKGSAVKRIKRRGLLCTSRWRSATGARPRRSPC